MSDAWIPCKGLPVEAFIHRNVDVVYDNLYRVFCISAKDVERADKVVEWRPSVTSKTPADNVQATLSQRGERYGDFTENAYISQYLKDAMGNTAGWRRLNAVQREALTMIAQKIAHILNGDPNYKDSWHDIQGYAKLAEDRCNHGEK